MISLCGEKLLYFIFSRSTEEAHKFLIASRKRCFGENISLCRMVGFAISGTLHGLNIRSSISLWRISLFFSFLPFSSTRNNAYWRKQNNEKHQFFKDTMSAYFTNCTKAALVGLQNGYGTLKLHF